MTKISQWVTTMASKTPGSTVSLVGQGSFLDKASPHMVGYMGKNAQRVNTPHDGWCPVCKTKGQTQALKTYRINYTQSIFLCTNPQCIYPLGYTPLDNIIANTADLKMNSPNKMKRRNITDLSPTPLTCEKKPKIDLPISGGDHTVQADLGKSVSSLPTLEYETRSPTRFLHDPKACTGSQMPNLSGTANFLSNSALRDKSSFPILPMGSLNTYALGQPDGVPLVQGGRQVVQTPDLEVMDTLDNGSLPPETGLREKIVGKVTETTESLNREHILNGPAFGLDPISSYISTPLLQDSRQECQVMENSSKEVSVPPRNIDAVLDLQSELPSSCERLKDDNLSLMGPRKEQIENMDNLMDEGNVSASLGNREARLLNRHSLIETSGDTVSSELQHESDQQMNLSSLLESCPRSPTCPEAVGQVNSFGSASLSDSLQFMQESCDMTTSHSLADVLQLRPAEGLSSTDLRKPVLSSQCLVTEGKEKSQPTLPSGELEECLSESLSKDNSDTPMHLPSLLPDESMVSTEDPSMPIPNLSLLEDLVQNCQKTSSIEQNLQDDVPENQVEVKALKNTCDSPITSGPSVIEQAYAAAIPLPNIEKNDISPPAGNLVDNQPVCHPADDSSNFSQDVVPESQVGEKVLKNTCDNPSTSAPSVKEQAYADAIPLPSNEKNDIWPPGDNLVDNQPICHPADSLEKQDSSNFSQDIVPESRLEEKALKNTCDSPITLAPSVKEQAHAAAIPLPSNEKNYIWPPADNLVDNQPICHPADDSYNISQDIVQENQVEERVLKNICDSPITLAPSVKEQADAAAIPLPNTENHDMAIPADSLVDNQPVCHPNDGSLEKVCEPHNSSASIMKDDARSLNKIPLPGPQILLQDCLKCHCAMNISSQSLQKNTCNTTALAPSVKDQVYADAAAISLPRGTSASIMRDDCKTPIDAKSPNKRALPGPQIVLQDCLKCRCGMNTPSHSVQNKQTLDETSASEVGSTLCGVSTNTDCEKVSAPPVECKSPLSEQKKKFYENAILPDLLLDIQLEHQLEETLSAAPSPECDAAMSTTLPSDMEVIKPEERQDGQVKESDDVMETEASEILTDRIQDGSKVSDTLEILLNSQGLADDDSEDMEAKSQGPAQGSETPALKRLKPTEKRLQWKNKYSLCWLDCILSTLVQSETLNHFIAKGRHIGMESIIRNLYERYGEATEMYINSLKKGKPAKKAVLRRPRYEKCLNEVRMEVFDKLKPLLNCKLGKNESPVFAFPLLLRQEPETERLFIHSFKWQFHCEVCGYSYQQRCQKTMTTFTKVLPEWHPLNAVHLGPCNQCHNTEQKRSMVLEKLNPIFMVHFVEGLPSSDLQEYSFQFKGHSYEVKTIIKFKNKHFSAWISNNGTWVDADGLRGSFCRRYQKFRVQPNDIHIVIWERSNGNAFVENEQLDVAEEDSEYNSTTVSMPWEDQMLSSLGAELSQQVVPTVPSAVLNTLDPLAGMEGYADDDVITLTLVEVPLDASGRPIAALTEPQPTDICTPLSEGENTHTAHPEMSMNLQLECEEDGTLTSPISSHSNADTVPLRNCSVVRSPLKPAGEIIATSTPIHQPYNAMKSVVGNWMTRLINKDKTILNSDPLVANNKILALKTCPPLKVTDSSGTSKKAQSFNGFEGRYVGKTSLLESPVFPSNVASELSFSAPEEKGAPVAQPLQAPPGFKMPGGNGLDYSKLSREGSSSSEDKIRKLRLKLLRKLKAKKSELSTLEKLAKIQQSGQANGVPQGGFNRKEHLRGFLQELQEHIDNVDNESVCTMSSRASTCSSPGDAEFFAELFSPSPVGQPSDSKLLEMLADGCGMTATGHLQPSNGHRGEGVLQPTSGSNSCPTSTTLNNSSTDDSLNLMSNSTLASLNENNDYFDFDDYF